MTTEPRTAIQARWRSMRCYKVRINGIEQAIYSGEGLEKVKAFLEKNYIKYEILQ